jgi:hypothetical protein
MCDDLKKREDETLQDETIQNGTSDNDLEIDATTGASPGTAQACNDLGLNSLEANLAKFNIKPPGQA